MEKPKETTITIVVRDGMVSDTISNDPNLIVEILDMDGSDDYDELEKKEQILSDLKEKIANGECWFI